MNPNQQPAGGEQYQNGGWYNGRQYWNGQFGNPGQIINPNQQGAGQVVSADVAKQTNPNNPAFLQSQGAQVPATAAQATPPGANGGTGGLGSMFSPMGGANNGVPNLQGIYDTSYTNNPDVQTAQKAITDLQGQITTRRQALDDATKNINDNPFYSEATRVGRVAKLNNDAQNDINTLTNQLQTHQTTLANAQAEAERQVNLATGQYNLNSQAYKQNLDQFNTLVSSGALTSASPQDIAQISAATGMSTDMINGIVQAQKEKEIQPQIITSTDNAGNVVITAVDKKTGNVINEQSLGDIGKGKTGRGGGGGNASTTSNNKNIMSDFNTSASQVQPTKVKGTYVGQFPQLVMQYAPIMSLQDIYKAYANSPLGKQYGAPKESAQDIKQIYNYYSGKQTNTNIQ